MYRSKTCSRILSGLALMALSLCSVAAFGQSIPSPSDFTGLMNATPSGDWSMKLWRYIFGGFADNPFSPGSPTTLLGSLFIVLNTALFTVGFAWAMYGVVSGVVQTAHEGEVLGKRLSTVWFPIRMTVGIAGMVPIFQGFTMFQSIMMLMTAVGIGIGNQLMTSAVDNTSAMQALVVQDGFVPTAVADVRKAAQNSFLSGVCLAAQQAAEATHRQQGTPLQPTQLVNAQPYLVQDKQESGYRFGSADDPQKCGSIYMQWTSRQSSSMTAFRSGGVDYGAIAQAAASAYKTGMEATATRSIALGAQWFNQRVANMNAGAAAPPAPLSDLNAISEEFIKGSRAAISNTKVNAQALNSDVKSNMTAMGWFGLGAWFSTFAEANAAIADAAKGPSISSTPIGAGSGYLDKTTADAVAAADDALRQALASERPATGDATRAILDSSIKDLCAGDSVLGSSWVAQKVNGMVGTATGNCSLGQGLVSAAIRASAIGSGGGGNGSTFSFDSTGLVNPVLMMKNLGDYVMSFSSSLLIGSAAVEWAATKFAAVGKVVKGAASVIGGAPDKSGDSIGELFSVLKLAAVLLLALGAFLSIYVPMIPFIVWIGALLAYAASVIEGLAGASLHAMAHLEGEGEGMGQRTSHGYLFLLNVVGRPALMVIAFFVASALMIVVGTLQAQMFLPAMANVQGNSLTGIFSIVGFLLIFGIMNLTLISASFNLIHVIPDQVIGFIGGNISSHLGRETEDKVHGVFMIGARFAPNAMGQVGALRDQLNKGKAAANKAGATASASAAGRGR
ncbi:DotA/TraY family protein [Ramlibacter sp. AN1133]|uniref:DotA/TraY family protein n=1 Tax=Ramlibacter sp. AN1133 TaxID=3133429 RepID=UPI0030C1AFCE